MPYFTDSKKLDTKQALSIFFASVSAISWVALILAVTQIYKNNQEHPDAPKPLPENVRLAVAAKVLTMPAIISLVAAFGICFFRKKAEAAAATENTSLLMESGQVKPKVTVLEDSTTQGDKSLYLLNNAL